MIEHLTLLGWNEKESKVYMYLIEYGISGASEIAKHLALPKSSVNFLADTLWKRGYLSKSIRGNTHYYEADVRLIEQVLETEAREKARFLTETLPILREMNANTHSRPKIIFFDGLENCKKAYLAVLDGEKEFYEFGAHADLSAAFGEAFMEAFIALRVKRGIFCHSIGTIGPIETALQGRDEKELRHLDLFPTTFGYIGSSIVIEKNAVLILNLKETYSGVRIENPQFAETMKTIFFLSKQ